MGIRFVSFTLCIKERRSVLIGLDLFKVLESKLLIELSKYKCGSHVHLFMPDHCHLLLQGLSDTSNVLNVIKAFKQKTAYWFSQSCFDFNWQKDFYDHIVRDEKDIENQVQYILNNPVRKNLVKYWKEYKYKGSTFYNFDEWD